MINFPEAIALPHGYFLEASPERFRVHRLMPWQPRPCQEHSAWQSDGKTTRHLMAGAFYAAMSHAVAATERTNAVSAAGVPSLLQYVHQLLSSYQTAHATPGTMRAIAARMRELQREDIAAHCLAVAMEESGHDTLALLDLTALGLPAEQLVRDYRPPNALQLVALFRQLAQSEKPIAALGYAFALERCALFTQEKNILAVEQLMPPGINATRCMRVHSAAGSDAGHVQESIALIALLPPADRAAIIHAVYTSVLLMSEAESDYPGDTAMQEILLKYGWPHAQALTT